MAELTATEKLERARKSIMVAEERLDMINKRLPELNSELENLIVIDETQGYRGRAKEKVQAEIESLQKEQASLEKTIDVLKRKMPYFEREARIEIAGTETVIEYKDAYSELKDLLSRCPSLDDMTNAIAVIQGFSQDLADTNTKYLSVSKNLADIMLSEKLESLDDITLETLRTDRSNIDYQSVLNLSDALIDLSEGINRLQYSLFHAATNNPIEYMLAPEPKPEPMFSECGRFKIEKEGDIWNGYIKETHFANGMPFDNWKKIYSSREHITLNELQKISDDIWVKGPYDP